MRIDNKHKFFIQKVFPGFSFLGYSYILPLLTWARCMHSTRRPDRIRWHLGVEFLPQAETQCSQQPSSLTR